MRWSCPHCGTQLALSEDKIGTGWSFARCYRCGGFALIRRSELSVIRVDKAPAGEAVLLPEATEDPRHALSAAAAQNLARTGAVPPAAPPSAPTIRPAPLRNLGAPDAMSAIQVAARSAIINPPEPAIRAAARLPEPLPDISSSAPILANEKTPRSGVSLPLLYGGMGVAALAAIASGGYLVLEGRSLLRQSLSMVNTPAAEAARPTASAEDVIPSFKPTENRMPENRAADSQPLENRETIANAKDVITDQVHHLAMAPARAPAAPVAAIEEGPGLLVHASRPGIPLYSGPGTQFPILGTADPEISYPVRGWSDQWFKIDLDGHAKIAWIRNDLAVPSR